MTSLKKLQSKNAVFLNSKMISKYVKIIGWIIGGLNFKYVDFIFLKNIILKILRSPLL